MPADALAAVAEASRQRAATNQRRVFVLAAAFAVALIVVSYLLQLQQQQLKAYVHQQCIQRQINTLRSNQIWADLGKIEADNKFVDAKIRGERLNVYQNAKLDVPICI